MPMWVFTTVFALAIVVTMIAGIWLLLHLTAFARTFAGNADIVPSPKRNRASRRTVRSVLAVFGLGLVLTLAMQIAAMTGAIDAWIRYAVTSARFSTSSVAAAVLEIGTW